MLLEGLLQVFKSLIISKWCTLCEMRLENHLFLGYQSRRVFSFSTKRNSIVGTIKSYLGFCCYPQTFWPGAACRRQGFSHLTTPRSHSPSLKAAITGTQAGNWRQRRDQGDMLRAGFLPWMLLQMTSYSALAHQPRGTVPTKLGPPSTVSIQDDTLQTGPQGTWWGHFLNWGSSSQIILAYFKLTETNQAKISPLSCVFL